MKAIVKVFIFLSLIIMDKRLFAQETERQKSIDNAAVTYMRVVGNKSALYYGVVQKDPDLQTSNHPYLKDELYAKARLSYHRMLYPEVLLRLDLSKDELITISPDFCNIVLFPEHVDFVELHGRHIIYLRKDILPGCPSTGYYFLIHSGNCMVLLKQIAWLKEDRYLSRYYDFRNFYYLYKDSVYHRIRNKRGLLKELRPYQKELKWFISASQLRFRHNTEEFITRTVSEYEKLSSAL